MLAIILFVLLCVLNFLDYHSTSLAMQVGAEEFNPIIRFFILNYGMESIIILKVVVLGFIGYALRRLFFEEPHNGYIGIAGLTILNIVFFFVVASNYLIYLKVVT